MAKICHQEKNEKRANFSLSTEPSDKIVLKKDCFSFVTKIFKVLSLAEDPPILAGGYKKMDTEQWIILHYSPFKVLNSKTLEH